MALEINIKGTVKELKAVMPIRVLCEFIHVDYYKFGLLPDDEVFEITQDDLVGRHVTLVL